ncbi:sensor histidine kinase [Aggregicoccus sp. 17bor-14]|uniref:sensor histidine kinase n=1 Tax=Myxococcaceae TaxID=31 RepID=UPI00129C3357|nr:MULTISPECIES: sensor histidine kinase [Myxococcaceae]MBF5041146.1 sensor histidine kinase [Simulacricoccus sp. 17bor-14]MRI86933.1 sensor histidine kinase [Aggregicoccus sp. 17bor-14]
MSPDAAKSAPQGPPTPTPSARLASAHRPFARAVGMGLALLAAIAIIGPLISYRSDVSASRVQMQARLARESALYADALSLHVSLLQAELERVAQQPEVNLRDDTAAPEELLLRIAHQGSSLFTGGVALLDLQGQVIRSEPHGLFAANTALQRSPWFQRVLATRGSTVDVFSAGEETLAVAVPVRNEGVLLGLVQASHRLVPQLHDEGESLAVLGPTGNVLFPSSAPAWVRQGGMLERVQALAAGGEGEQWELAGTPVFAAANAVRGTPLWLLMIADQHAAIAPLRGRMRLQLLFIAVLQVATLLLFALSLRRIYRGFLAFEARVTQSEKLAALGTASSLIAHEVKNSLNGLGAAVSMLELGGDAATSVKTLRGQTNRLGHLARSLLAFGKPPVVHRVPVQLERVAQEAVDGLAALPERSEVQVTVHSAGPLRVQADPLMLVTAIDNLVRNAIEAAVGAKDLGRVSAPWVRVSAERDGRWGQVRVEDNAGGPPPGFEERLFEPFVTSKPKGIGLGLSMAHQALVDMGGKLAFERTAAGSCFTVRLELEP